MLVGAAARQGPAQTGFDIRRTPSPGSQVRKYLWKRQLDSLSNDHWLLIRRLVLWMTRPIQSTGTGRRFNRAIAPRLERGKPVPICLVKAGLENLKDPIQAFITNHPVLAIGYRRHAHPEWRSHWDLDIYDPNYPDEVHTLHDLPGFRIQTRRSRVFDGRLRLVRHAERLDGNVVGTFRGYFDTAYAPSPPPWTVAEPVAR